MTQATLRDLNTSSEQEWGYGHLFAILIRRRLWFFGGLLSVLVAAVLLTIRSRPLYQSAMQILIESSYRAKGRTADESFTDPNITVDTSTQLTVLRGAKLLQEAVERAQDAYPTLTVDELRQSFAMEPIYGSDKSGKGQVATSVLRITYISDDPAKTKYVLGTLLSVYQAYDERQQEKRLNKGLEFINQQIPAIEKKLLDAEAALQAFRQGENLINPAQQAASKQQRLEQAKREREALQAQYQDVLATYNQLKQKVPASPTVVRDDIRLTESSRYQVVLNQIQALESELAIKRNTLTPDHPELQDLERNLETQKQSLAQTRQQVLGSSDSPAQGPPLRNQGQLGSTDVNLSNQLTQLESQLEGMQARDRSLRATETKLEAELKQFPELIARYNRLQPQIESQQATLQRLRDAQQELALKNDRGSFKWETVEEPELGEQVSPNVFRNLLLGTVVGTFFGVMAVFLREVLDDKVHDPLDLGSGSIPLPLLGTVPILTKADAKEALVQLPFNQLEVQESTTPDMFQWQPLREALDLIYANIQLLKGSNPYKSLMVTSALPGEGKSTLALGLAISASRLDQRVLLIDADLRKPSLHEIFNLNNSQGLSTLLAGDVPEEEFRSTPQWVYMRWEEKEAALEDIAMVNMQVLPPADLSIDVLTTGPVSSDPVKLLSRERIQEVIASFRDSYDLILIDSPPVLGLVDTIPVGLGCDGVVMVSRMEKITHSELTNAIERLGKLNLIGLVANGVNQPTHSSTKYLSA